MPGDREKSRRRKIQQLELQFGAGADRSWMKWKICELCRNEFCVNNYEDRRSRTPKVLGRPICARCLHANGKVRMAEHVFFEKLAASECMELKIAFLTGTRGVPRSECKCLPCRARRYKEKLDANATSG